MTNEVATTNGNAVGFPTEGPDPFAQAAAEMGAIKGFFLKFDGNSGDYNYGPADDSKDMEHGTQLAVNMTTFKRGFICWKDGDPVDEIMVAILAGSPPPVASLADHGPYQTYDDGSEDGWMEQNSIELRSLETGELFLFKGTSKSAHRAFGSLLAEFSKVYRQKPGMIPVIEIGASSFEPKVKGKDGKPGKKIGKKYAPILKIVGWIPVSEFEALAAKGDASAAAPSSEEEAGKGGSEDPSNYAASSPEMPLDEPAEKVADADKVEVPATGGRRAKRF